MGGLASSRTSELVKEDGSVEEGFNLEYETISSCAISDEDNNEVIVTGGSVSNNPSRKTVSVYNEAGFQRYLSPMNEGRYRHACSSFTLEGEKVLIVTGGSDRNFELG